MDYWHFNFACPYFMWDTKTDIGCENKTALRFPDKKTCRRYLKAYCVGDWKKCTYAKALNEFYEGDTDGKYEKNRNR